MIYPLRAITRITCEDTAQLLRPAAKLSPLLLPSVWDKTEPKPK